MSNYIELAVAVDKAFDELSKKCPHKDDVDCAHPDIEFKCMMCSISNCPLLGDD